MTDGGSLAVLRLQSALAARGALPLFASLRRAVALWLNINMRLLTAHKILISAAAVFFFFFGFWEVHNYTSGGDVWAIFRAILYFAVAVGFGVYFRNLDRLYGSISADRSRS
ncbi:MAG TPA: hypothetical protein VIB79_25255 [Candidatus Binatia bacterium]|jgi:hypothetical protein